MIDECLVDVDGGYVYGGIAFYVGVVQDCVCEHERPARVV